MKAKKILKWGCGIAAAILAALLLLIGSFIYVTRYRITDVDAATSPDGTYEIVFQAVGEPDWPFGYSHARIVLKRNGETVTKHKFDVANDGGVLHPENWSVRWEENCVKIMISGEEQPDAFYTYYYLDRHWTAANLLRLRPVDHDLYAWTETYIAPIGYQNVNLFLLDWDSSDFGNVCFNDLLAQMYRMEHGDYLFARDYPYSEEPFYHSIIPADLFESVIYKHFNISLDEFRKRALYDAEKDAYPWQDVNGGNVLYYPELIPEVTKVTENADGTVTLHVNVICTDQHTDHLFEHEVTMNIETDGSFQYLSNKIVYRSENELPSPQARMEVQRFDVED